MITSSAPIPGLATGQKVTILGAGGNTAANNTVANPQWTITKVDTTHFSLNTSTGNGAWTSGGSISGPGYALALITNGNEPIENTFTGGAYFNALSFDDDAGHGANHIYGIATSDGFLIPQTTTAPTAGLLHPDYYLKADTGAGWSRLLGRLKFVDTTGVLGYMKFYPATRCVAIGDNLETFSCTQDLSIVRTGANATLNMTAAVSGDAQINIHTANANQYTIKSDQTNNWFSISSPVNPAIRLVPGSTAEGSPLPWLSRACQVSGP